MHLLATVSKFPQFTGFVQSALRFLESSRIGDQAAPGTRPGVFHTTSNWPFAAISPISTGLVMWWFGSISDTPPVRLGTFTPMMASIILSGSVVPAFFTASTHMLKPITWASIGSLVTRLGFLMNAFHLAMNSLLIGVSIDWK